MSEWWGQMQRREDHDLVLRVCRACAANGVAAGIASPLTYQQVGLLYCGIDTTVPGTYTITYTAQVSFNGNTGPLATATRTVVVLSVCSTGEQLCSDGLCSEGGSCVRTGTSAPASPPPAAPVVPPTLVLNTSGSQPVSRVFQG